MNADAIRTLMNYNAFTIDKNAEGISHEESLRQPQPAGNCLNWVLGHIVANRHVSLAMLGVEPLWSPQEIERYRRGSSPVTGAEEAASWDQLRAAEAKTRQLLAEAMKTVSRETLDTEVENKNFGDTVGANLLALQWHEGYHAGQLGVLRRLAGKEGALK